MKIKDILDPIHWWWVVPSVVSLGIVIAIPATIYSDLSAEATDLDYKNVIRLAKENPELDPLVRKAFADNYLSVYEDRQIAWAYNRLEFKKLKEWKIKVIEDYKRNKLEQE